MDVRRDKMPARMDADTTTRQLTDSSKAAEPMVASAVCAIVLIALLIADFQNLFM
jgi:hypothetical protein